MTGPLFRILDANANRAREALRMVEDYSRFALNDEPLCEELKHLRHDLVDSIRNVVSDAMLWRDTRGDVGTGIKTDSEKNREDLAQIVTAAGKRLGEALRVIEECLKTSNPAASSTVEQLRYRFYDIEKRLARTLHLSYKFTSVKLYVLITENICKLPWMQAAEQAILGGADCLQLREKELPSGELLKRAKSLAELCRKHNILSIINDRPDIAVLSNADGVHVGQDDLPAIEARKITGREKIVGVSTHNLDQAHQAVRDGADYIGVGPFFKSSTKTRDFVAGPEYARQVAQNIRIPAVAIAGITEENVDQVLATGIKAVAVTASLIGCENPREAASRLKQKLLQ